MGCAQLSRKGVRSNFIDLMTAGRGGVWGAHRDIALLPFPCGNAAHIYHASRRIAALIALEVAVECREAVGTSSKAIGHQ